jgi:hypothetical protein
MESLSITDPGRILRHALVYVARNAARYPIEAWASAENILYRAHTEYEDDDRIEFVRYIEKHEILREELAVPESALEYDSEQLELCVA